MKNVLLATLEYPPHKGGIATYLKVLVDQFPPDAVTVLAPADEEAAVADADSNVPIYRKELISSWFRPKWLPAWYWMDRMIQAEKKDLLIVSHVLPMGTAALLNKLHRGTPYIVIIHGLDIALAMEKGGFKRWLACKILREAEQVVANSEFTAQFAIRAGVCRKDIAVVRPPAGMGESPIVSADRVSAMRKAVGFNESFGVLALGRLVARKGFSDILSAVSELRREGRDVRLCIAGSGPEEKGLVSLATELGIREYVHFSGRVSDANLPVLYASCDTFVSVPKSNGADMEGFGIVYLEAAMLGKPVVGTRVGGVTEAVLAEETGILVEPGSSEKVARAIARLMDDPDFAKKLGEQGRQRAMRDFAGGTQASAFVTSLMNEN